MRQGGFSGQTLEDPCGGLAKGLDRSGSRKVGQSELRERKAYRRSQDECRLACRLLAIRGDTEGRVQEGRKVVILPSFQGNRKWIRGFEVVRGGTK